MEVAPPLLALQAKLPRTRVTVTRLLPLGEMTIMRLQLACLLSSVLLSPADALAASPVRRMALSRPHVRTTVHVRAAMPALPTLAAACALPTCLGFWKTEYGVSYAYGAATATFSALVLRASSGRLAAAHALCILCYGVRLNCFLLWRELNIERFRKFRETIEERSKASGGRLKRTPFVLSCAFLYFCMCSPLLITAKFAPSPTCWPVLALIAAGWSGFGIAAIGDTYKSLVKARRGAEHLVTGGIYRFLRHPNYTGEQLLWSANMLSGFAAAICAGPAAVRSASPLLAASVIGWAGIMFVLARATSSLEKKQAERYNEFNRYRKVSWGGLGLKNAE